MINALDIKGGASKLLLFSEMDPTEATGRAWNSSEDSAKTFSNFG